MKKKTIRCPYCGSPAILKDASYVYGDRSYGGKVYVCSHYPDCDSYVGVITGTALPKGSLANKALRRKRVQAHQAFDQIWKQGILNRQDAYRWLAEKFCLDRGQAHIGEFSDYMCEQPIREASKVLEYNHVSMPMAG